MTAQSWNSDFYDRKLDYVSELGRGAVDLLAPKRGETILDLGCGTGDLAHEIAKSGASVIGIDLSAEMVAAARAKYPDIDFRVGDGENFSLEQPVDAVFSNAALHWMRRPERVIRCVWDALKPGGRFVAEFGGKGNVGTVVDAILRVLRRDFGIDAAERNPGIFRASASMPRFWNGRGSASRMPPISTDRRR
jgi:trans-aconitate methyltransferase